MSLDNVIGLNQKAETQTKEYQAVETFKRLVDERKYTEARRFFKELDETARTYIRGDKIGKLYLRELSFASL